MLISLLLKDNGRKTALSLAIAMVGIARVGAPLRRDNIQGLHAFVQLLRAQGSAVSLTLSRRWHIQASCAPHFHCLYLHAVIPLCALSIVPCIYLHELFCTSTTIGIRGVTFRFQVSGIRRITPNTVPMKSRIYKNVVACTYTPIEFPTTFLVHSHSRLYCVVIRGNLPKQS